MIYSFRCFLRAICDGLGRTFGARPVLSVPILFTSVVLVLGPSTVQAQSNGEGSIYSRFGVGTLIDFSSSQSQALGGGAYALRSLNYNPNANPALWSDQIYTRFSGSMSYRTINSTDGRGNTSDLTSGTMKALQFSFPLYEQTLGVGISFQPYSRSNYKAVRSGNVEIGPQRDSDVPYHVRFTGSGGLHRLRGGLGYRVNQWLSVGASLDFLFGILESQRRTTFESSALRNVVVSDGTQMSGLSGSLGSHLSFANVFASNDALSVGAAVTLPATLTGTHYRVLNEDLARDTLGTQEGKITLPWEGRLGVSYQPDQQWTFVVDGLYAPWTTFSSTFSGLAGETNPTRFPTGGESTLTNRWRLSMGAEVLPAGDNSLAGYFAQTVYRLGGYVERMYVRPDGQTNLYAYAATAGISLPTSLSGTRIDLNTIVGMQGTTTDSLVRDTFYGISLHVNFGERWFQRRKLR